MSVLWPILNKAWFTLLLFVQTPAENKLMVNAQGFRNADGQAAVALFQSADGFPESTEKAIRKATSPIVNGTASVTFGNLPNGVYAIVVLHDTNGSLSMDRGLFGRPKEGYGVSNNAKPGMFGPPKFQDAAFQLGGENHEITIKLRY